MRTRLIVFLLLILNVHSPGQLYINEFLSANVNGILDEDLSQFDELEKMEAESDRETSEMFEEIAQYLIECRRFIGLTSMI